MNKIKTAVISAISVGALAGAMFASAQSATTATCFQFTQNMKLGTTGAEVLQLQKTLNTMGYTVSTTGVGSVGYESTYFGAKTKAAAIKFQAANNIIQTGNVYALTRAALNAKCVATPSTGTSTPTTSGAVSVSLASSQPNNVLVAGAARATLANVVFTGNGIITNVKLMRTGVSNNETLDKVYLYDTVTGQRLTDAASASADGSISFNGGLGLFTVSGSRTVSVVADILGGTSGQSVGVSLTGYTVSGSAAAVISGINGPSLPIGSAILASVTGIANQVTGGDVYAPTQSRVLWRTDLNVQTRTVNLSAVTLKMVGSAPVSSIANAGLFLDGKRVATAVADSNNMFYFNTGTKYPLTTGSHTVELRADVLSGASRSFNFVLENASDIVIEDSSFVNTYITVSNFSNIRTGGSFKIVGVTTSSTNVTVYKDSTYTPSSVPAGQTNLTIAKYKMYGNGEDIKITSLTIDPKATSASTTASSSITAKLQNVSLVVSGGDYGNGTQVGSTNNTGANYTYTLNSQMILRAGVTYTLEVKADLIEKSSGLQLLAGDVSSNITSLTAEGLYSYNSKTDSTNYPGQLLTIGNAGVNFAKKIGGVQTSASKNQPDVKIGSFQFQVGTVEDVELTQITVDLGGSWNANQISNLRVSNSNNSVSTAFSSGNYFSPTTTLITKGSVITIDVLANLNEISDNATITPVVTVDYTGVGSHTRATKLATGDMITIRTVNVANPTVVAGNLSAQYVVGGTTPTVGSYKFVATNGTAKITEATFGVTPGTIQSVTFGGVNAPVVGSTVTVQNVNFSIPQGTLGASIPLVVTYAPVSTTGGATSGTASVVTLTGFKYDGGNGTVATSGLSLAMNSMTLVASKPTVSVSNTNAGLSGGLQKLVEFTVTPDTAGQIKLDSIKFNVSISSTSGTLAGYKLYANGSEISGSSCVDATKVCTLPANYEFTSQQTLSLYATVSGALGAAGSSSVTTSLDAGNFMWTDTAGGSITSVSGSLINGFPTNSWTLKN